MFANDTTGLYSSLSQPCDLLLANFRDLLVFFGLEHVSSLTSLYNVLKTKKKRSISYPCVSQGYKINHQSVRRAEPQLAARQLQVAASKQDEAVSFVQRGGCAEQQHCILPRAKSLVSGPGARRHLELAILRAALDQPVNMNAEQKAVGSRESDCFTEPDHVIKVSIVIEQIKERHGLSFFLFFLSVTL